jgi:hypothetical protein
MNYACSQQREDLMFTKSLLMPAGFAALAFSGLMFQIAAHAFSAPVTLLHP